MGAETLASPLSSTTGPKATVLADAGSYAPNAGLLRLPAFARPDALIDAIRAGRPVILCDDEDRENEGDLVFAAQFATPALVTFMIRQCGGLICAALAPTLVARFGLAPMVRTNRDPKGTAFTASVDAAVGIGTGISARDRARTIRLLGDAATTPDDLVSPGHVFPLAARAGGLAERQGHTEVGRHAGGSRRPGAGRRDLRDPRRGWRGAAARRAAALRGGERFPHRHRRRAGANGRGRTPS